MSYPRVIGSPAAPALLTQGIGDLNQVLRLTLGPAANRVAATGRHR